VTGMSKSDGTDGSPPIEGMDLDKVGQALGSVDVADGLAATGAE